MIGFIPIAIAITMAVLDGAIVNVALPSIARDMVLKPEEAIWIVNIYNLAVTISLLPLASLGDSLGYKRVYWWGLVVFTIASLLCANAVNLNTFVIARFIQGLGAAGIMSVNIALVRHIFPANKLGVGMGYTALVVGVSAAAGPSISAAILSVAKWHWLFLINVPAGVLALVMASRYLPQTGASGVKISITSIILNALTFGLLIAGLNSFSTAGDFRIAALMTGAAVLIGGAFVLRERRMKLPILPVDLLRMPVFALSLTTSITCFAAQNMGFVALPFIFANKLGYSEAMTGLLMSPWPVVTASIAPIAGRLSDRYPPERVAAIGLLVFSCGWVSVALMSASPHPFDIVWRLALCGLGFGMMQSPNNRVIISSAPRERSGGASGLQALGRLLGQSFGAIIVALIFAFGAGNDVSFVAWTAAALSLLAAGASVMRRPPSAQ
ncbi:MFS transporter [Aestuariivirga litoralis]|nr:MFS transporter [Aestuariivirga litoralis]